MQISVQHQQLTIRHFINSDKNDFIHIVQHPLCMKYSAAGVLSKQQANACFESLSSSKKNRMYAIEESVNRRVIGCTGLQECCVEYDASASFVLCLLPEFNQHQDLHPLLLQFVDHLISLHQLPYLQAIVAQKNHFNMQLLSDLNFKRVQPITCQNIDSYLYQTR